MNKEKISISTCFNYEIPIEKQIPLVVEAGFTKNEKEQIDMGPLLNRIELERILEEMVDDGKRTFICFNNPGIKCGY